MASHLKFENMSQTPLPFLFMRGGTSRGPYFLKSDLPEEKDALSDVLVAVVGAGNPRNIDGLGGGNAVTTKVAMLSRSDDPVRPAGDGDSVISPPACAMCGGASATACHWRRLPGSHGRTMLRVGRTTGSKARPDRR